MASRRTRGPVAFWPRLSAGVALSIWRPCTHYHVMSTANIMTSGSKLRLNHLGAFSGTQHKVGAGSVRNCFGDTTNKMKGRYGLRFQPIDPELPIFVVRRLLLRDKQTAVNAFLALCDRR
jgi:hypothetical protein